MTMNVGLRLVETLYQQLMVDDEWAVRRERGFTWWAYRLAQHVEVGQAVWSEDRYVSPVAIWTEVVRDVDPAADPASVLAVLNTHATLSALIWDEANATVIECCTAWIHDEVFTWMSKVLSTAAVLQNTAAHTRAHSLATACGGVPAVSEHPINGERPGMDDLLNFPKVIAQEGRAPSRFVGPEMERASDWLAQMQIPASTDATSLTCEVAFTEDAPALVTDPSQLQTALVQIFTDAPHPDFGNGALMLMRLPISVDSGRVPGLANDLNLEEAQATLPTALLGAWCPDPTSHTTLAFCSFVPNMLARWMTPTNLVIYQTSRSRFAAIQLAR